MKKFGIDISRWQGDFDLAKAKLLAYNHGEYYGLGEYLGKFGYSVKKK